METIPPVFLRRQGREKGCRCLECRRQRTTLLLAGVHAQPLLAFAQSDFDRVIGIENMFGSIDDALNRAREMLGLPREPRPPTAVPEVARERDRAATTS